jgi:hypothetical protein
MQAVVETHVFRRSAADAGMTEDEIFQVIDFLAANPQAGDEIKGTGGCRKVRVAGRGKGKSGGYRVITFFSGPAIPLFLVYAYSKADRSDLDGAQRADLKRMTKVLVDEFRSPRRRRSMQ